MDDRAYVRTGGEHRGVQPPLAGRPAALAGADCAVRVERHDVAVPERGGRQAGGRHEEATFDAQADVAGCALVEAERLEPASGVDDGGPPPDLVGRRHDSSWAMANGAAGMRPRSVRKPETSRAGVTSKAQLRTSASAGVMVTPAVCPLSARP